MATSLLDRKDPSSDDDDDNENSYDENEELWYDSDDDDYYDTDDTTRLGSLWKQISDETQSNAYKIPVTNAELNAAVDLTTNYTPECSNIIDSLEVFVNDSLRLYLTASPLICPTNNGMGYRLNIDPVADEFDINQSMNPELYVGNLSSDTEEFDIKDFFLRLKQEVHVVLKSNKKGARYAFVRFKSGEAAEYVLNESKIYPSKFSLKGKQLQIDRTRGSPKPNSNDHRTPDIAMHQETKFRVAIQDVYFGTLLTGIAFKNIQLENNDFTTIPNYGIIPNRLQIRSSTSYYFNIDMSTKKLSIECEDMRWRNDSLYHEILIQVLQFEWDFHNLKTRKITPVFVNEKEVFLLMELRRAPKISEQLITSGPYSETSTKNRLPGFGVIGHANAWLFKLDSKTLAADYRKLFQIFSRNNLTPQWFDDSNILRMINTEEAARKYLKSLFLISSNEWIRLNQDMVDHFLKFRWPSYPFETKFEIMKLISKHIITVHDLIVDDNAEQILKRCSINTLQALTDKIAELAPQSHASMCDDEEENWDYQSDEEEQEQESYHENNKCSKETTYSTATLPKQQYEHIRSCRTGEVICADDADIASVASEMKKISLNSAENNLGTFSRLLITAIEQLLRRNEIWKTEKTNIYVTRLELHQANSDTSSIRKVYITPSSILYEGPYCEEKCAVTRQFENYHDRFLRVAFRDEDYGYLHNVQNNMTKMYLHIKKVLKEGVIICNRHYQFVAFSSSQLREHSCWMFAATADHRVTADSIREWMGNFRGVRPVAKLAARLGQSFSTTIKGIHLEERQIRQISDVNCTEVVNRRRREHCLTDGIGIITSEFAKRLCKQMKLPDPFCSSAFQIRCGGYKGMVCVDTIGCITHPDVVVYFRPSMNKFIATAHSLDVVRSAVNPSLGFLNRQIIILLSCLGINDDVFISLQDQMLQQLDALTAEANEACKSLLELGEFGGNGYHNFLIEYLTKIQGERDPFARQLLHVIKAFCLKELRTKAKVRAPKSWCLLGVADETRTLNYGEVFIQIDTTNQEKENGKKQILEGPVIVTRNPCFHPGDIRKLTAVDVPELRVLKNVIVFPLKPPRPHPKEMSGGDLDGDTFWISQYPKFIFNSNEEPFDYQEQEDEAKSRQSTMNTEYTMDDVCDFFGEYVAADNLGIIANSHLAFADQLADKTKHPTCLQLARMHSVAVDFAKSGVSAPRLTREFRPTVYPHFMEKNDKPQYKSASILGQLYDRVACYDSSFCLNDEDMIRDTARFPYESFSFDGKQDYIEDAYIIKQQYDRDLKRIMRQYGIKHEVEVISGYILKFTAKQHEKVAKLYELRNEIRHAYKLIQEKYLCLFWEEFYPSANNESREDATKWSDISKKLTWTNQIDYYEFNNHTNLPNEVLKKASAWFHVTYEPWLNYIDKHRSFDKRDKHRSQHPTSEPFKELLSFAWLVYPLLLEIYTCNVRDSSKSKPSFRRRRIRTNRKNRKLIPSNKKQ